MESERRGRGMMRKLSFAAGLACMALANVSHAGFVIHGSAVTSSERGLMGARTHETPEAQGAFRVSDAALTARQRRLEGAELLVDLAYQPVTQRGSGPADAVHGFADDVPFATGMAMILPQGWQVYRDSELRSGQVPRTISFLGGAAWPEVLAQLGDRYALQFHIDWYDRVVMMKPGRDGLLAQVDRVRIIAEPAPKQAAVVTGIATTDQDRAGEPNEVIVAGAGEDQPLVSTAVNSAPGQIAGLPVATGPGLKVTVTPSGVGTGSGGVDSGVAQSVAEAVPVLPPAPVTHTMLVLKGTLYENVVRLSELNGWNSPDWRIDGDYRIQADYTINADTFQEAMAKLLLLHPVEADVNLSQRKIYVLKELR